MGCSSGQLHGAVPVSYTHLDVYKRQDGSLTGYAGGIDKKIALLKLEGTDKDESLCATNIG